MIQCKPSCQIIKERETRFDESLFADVSIKGYNLRLAVIYNPPRTNKIDFVEKFDRFLENNNSANQPMIVCGDMNPDISSRSRLTQNYLNCIEANNFNIEPLKATRVTLGSKTCLDHFIYQNLLNEKVEVLEIQGITDHYPVKIMLSAKIERENTRNFYRDISFTKSPSLVLEDKKSLLQHLQANEDLIYQNNCPCSAFSEFSRLFREVTDFFAPIRNAKCPYGLINV